MQIIAAFLTDRDVCSRCDIIFLCGPMWPLILRALSFIRWRSAQTAPQGRFVLQLGLGTPEDAVGLQHRQLWPAPDTWVRFLLVRFL
jgi:hypothetical protein